MTEEDLTFFDFSEDEDENNEMVCKLLCTQNCSILLPYSYMKSFKGDNFAVFAVL